MSFIKVNKEKCNQEGICVAVCPTGVIRMDSEQGYPNPVPDFNDFCIRCGYCVTFCPTGALSLDWLDPDSCKPIKKELAVSAEQAEQFLCGRRSIRTFKEKKVPGQILERLLDVACMAPSAKNQQPWHWIVIQDPQEVKRYTAMAVDRMRTIIEKTTNEEERTWYKLAMGIIDEGYELLSRGAPHVVILHADRNLEFVSQDCTLALCCLDLYATSIGLGTCWATMLYEAINAHPPLFNALGIPSDHLAFGALAVGYPKFKPQSIPVRNCPRVVWK